MVSNAGMNFPGDVEFLTIEQYKKVADVNLYGGIRVVQHTLPLIRESKGNRNRPFNLNGWGRAMGFFGKKINGEIVRVSDMDRTNFLQALYALKVVFIENTIVSRIKCLNKPIDPSSLSFKWMFPSYITKDA